MTSRKELWLAIN